MLTAAKATAEKRGGGTGARTRDCIRSCHRAQRSERNSSARASTRAGPLAPTYRSYIWLLRVALVATQPTLCTTPNPPTTPHRIALHCTRNPTHHRVAQPCIPAHHIIMLKAAPRQVALRIPIPRHLALRHTMSPQISYASKCTLVHTFSFRTPKLDQNRCWMQRHCLA